MRNVAEKSPHYNDDFLFKTVKQERKDEPHSTMELDRSSSSSLDVEPGVTKSLHQASGDVKTYERTSSDDGLVYNYRQNHVSHVMLAGVHIVSLHIDGRERLCLAQISNTLLKQFSYNEIHNRRVALGITCVQCTPVQLEILRRAGAMPISSRRCGMITKREAERLVKSFLEDNKPPKLPDSFFFEVQHQCGWGCRGKFEPARYNSSRAKCIKCSFCNLYFSPNKFIFHFHRAPDSKYSHPDAANFNSWRRHLNLVSGTDSEEAVHAWEDVKAMFNGGSRKRMVSSPTYPSNRHQQSESPELKKQKLQVEDTILSKTTFRAPYQNYPIFTMPGNNYPFSHLATPNPLALSYHLGKSEVRDDRKPHNLPVPWRPTSDFIIPTYDFLWTNQFGPRSNGMQAFRPNFFPTTPHSPVKDLSMTESDRKTPSDHTNSSEDEENLSPVNVTMDNLKSTNQRLSAFKPVLKFSEHSHPSPSESGHGYGQLDKERDIDTDDLDVGSDEGYGDNSDKAIDLAAYRTKHTAHSSDISKPADNVIDNVNVNAGESHVEAGSVTETTFEEQDTDTMADDNSHENRANESDINSNKEPYVNLENINKLSKGDLQILLQREMDLRRQVENDINKIKQKLNDQLIKQIPEEKHSPLATEPSNVAPAHSSGNTDVLCFELEQERKARFSMQQKLKEAQMALYGFSDKGFSGMKGNDYPYSNASSTIPR